MNEKTPTRTFQQLNCELAAALGVTNPERCARLELHIVPGALPLVTVRLRLSGADGLRQVIERWRLVPRIEADPPIPAEEARDAA